MSILRRHPSGRLCGSRVALAVAAACGFTAALMASSRSAERREVVVLGDSLAVSPSRRENFPAHLQARIARAGLPWTVRNAGISGDTTRGGLRRLDQALDRAAVLVLALGANDGLRGIDVATVEANLASIIEAARARGVQVLLCGMETPPRYGWNYTLAFHSLFPRLAARYSIPLVPFLLSGVALVPEMNGPDLIHPNAAGSLRIADTVWPYLEPLLQQASDPAQPAA